ncbi:hypothetical protein ACHAXT_003186 [Thalassiosira profunda]
MAATSPYAPLRRQSSLLSNASAGGGRALRRSSSASVVVANAAPLAWIFLRFWARTSGDDGGGAPSMRAVLAAMADAVQSALTVKDEDGRGSPRGSSDAVSRHNFRGISAILRWIYNIVGSDRTKMGRVVSICVGFAREILLRSIGAASVVLTGAPALGICNPASNVEGSPSSDREAQLVMNGFSEDKTRSSEVKGDIDAMTIRRERQQIEQVLRYWFGQASPDGAQKGLWMIASSSVELLHQVDSDIADQFGALVADLVSGKLQLWTDNVDVFGWQGKLAAIIALDQMSRHIHRWEENNPQKVVEPLPKQETLDRLAYDVSKRLQQEHCKELSTGMIPVPMRVFGIMPLRHASTVQDLGVVQQDVESAAALHEEMDRMIRRFRKATNRRMAALQDDARRKGKLGSSGNDPDDRSGVEDEQWTDEMILECFPFEADMSKARDHVVVKTIAAFLGKMNILPMTDARCKTARKTAPYVESNATTSSSHVPTAIVSLSGGVDSMVIASALAYLRDAEASRRNVCPESVLRLVAIHIDYANRPESGAEAAYVGKYCQELGAAFVCRRIDEVTRGVTARDDYERKAREIRFSLYRQCCDEASNGTGEGGVGIMLGHHRGDLRENVISNAHKGCGPLDLSGMTAVSTNDGVQLFRPLLSLEKSAIYDYSHAFGVPYFKDTTPHWSTRGKLRNRLVPLLEEIYGEGSMEHLSCLAEESDDARALVEQSVMGPLMERVKRYPMGIAFETAPWKDVGLFFWKIALRQLLHSAGLGMFSDKSVESFLDRIRATKLREGWLQCRKDYAVFLQSDGRVFIFYPSTFPFGNGQNKDRYDNNQTFLGYGSDSSLQVGPWTITSEIAPTASEEEANSLLQTKALHNMEELMAGDVQYFLKVPLGGESSLPCPLIRVRGFTKPTRPAAWKGFDLKVESTLPLLGVDQSEPENASSNSLQEFGKTWTVAKVRLLLDSNSK